MKNLTKSTLFIVAFLLLTACQSGPKKQDPTILVGDISYQEVQKTYPYFQSPGKTVAQPADAIEQLKAVSEETHLTVYFGVWCHDSIREVPELIALLDTVNNPNINYQLISLNMKKQEPQGRAKANNILYTPTIVVTQANKELGRIIEKPEQDLATDLAAILNAGKD